MKKNLAAKLCLLGLLCVAFVCAVSMTIDPYNVFHWSSVRDNGVEPNKNYVKTQYILHHPEKYDTFIFGNSRVGSMDAAKIGDTCYNMYYSEGLPAESYENLRAFLDAGVQVRRVYLGIDDVSCFVDPSIHDDQLIRRPFRADEAELLFLLDYLDASVALQSLETICAYTGEEPAFHERLYSTGNYYLDTLTVNGSVTEVKSGKATFTMPAQDVTVSALFVKNGEYAVRVGQYEHVSVKADKTVAAEGETVKLTVYVDFGYQLSELLANNERLNQR